MNPSIYPNSSQQGGAGPYSATSDLTNVQRQILQPHQGYYSNNIYQQQQPQTQPNQQSQQQTQSPSQSAAVAQGYYMTPEVAASYQHQMYPGYPYMPQQGPGSQQQQQYPGPQYHQYPQIQLQGVPGPLPPHQQQHQQLGGIPGQPRNYPNVATVTDPTGQSAPPGAKPKVTTTLWEDEGTLCFQVEAKGICVARREDNDMINGTKLLNVAGMTRGRRDGILKGEKNRHVVKAGAMHLKGVWIPYDRAIEFANKEKIIDLLYPLFVTDIKAVLYHPANYARTAQVLSAAEKRKQEAFEKKENITGAVPNSASVVGTTAGTGSSTGGSATPGAVAANSNSMGAPPGSVSSTSPGNNSGASNSTVSSLPPLTNSGIGATPQYYYSAQQQTQSQQPQAQQPQQPQAQQPQQPQVQQPQQPQQQDYSGQNSRVNTPSRGPYPYLPQPNYYQPGSQGVAAPVDNSQATSVTGQTVHAGGENASDGAANPQTNNENDTTNGSSPLNGLLNHATDNRNGGASSTSPRLYHSKQEFDDRG